MASIVINNICNLDCPYCFVSDIKAQPVYNMSINEFQEALDFLGQTQEFLNLFGGEPTLHPNFDQILSLSYNYCIENNTDCMLFTNGLNLLPYLSQLEQFGSKIFILINCNSQLIQTFEQWQTFLNNLDGIFANETLREQIILGYNIYLNETDWTDFWTIVDRYPVTLRVSIAAPGGIFVTYKDKKEEYYTLLKPLFLQFISEAKERNCSLNIDCNHIPYCFFTEEELALITEVCGEPPKVDICNSPIAILSNYEAMSCFMINEKVNYKDFDDVDEMRTYFVNRVHYNYIINNDDMCKDCKKFQHSTCQGGCLAFSKLNR